MHDRTVKIQQDVFKCLQCKDERVILTDNKVTKLLIVIGLLCFNAMLDGTAVATLTCSSPPGRRPSRCKTQPTGASRDPLRIRPLAATEASPAPSGPFNVRPSIFLLGGFNPSEK